LSSEWTTAPEHVSGNETFDLLPGKSNTVKQKVLLISHLNSGVCFVPAAPQELVHSCPGVPVPQGALQAPTLTLAPLLRASLQGYTDNHTEGVCKV